MMAAREVLVGIDVSKDGLEADVRPLEIGFWVGTRRAAMAS